MAVRLKTLGLNIIAAAAAVFTAAGLIAAPALAAPERGLLCSDDGALTMRPSCCWQGRSTTVTNFSKTTS